MMNSAKMFIFLHGYNAKGDAMKILDESFKKIVPEGSIFLYPDAPFKVNNSDNFCWFPFVFDEDPFSINEEFVYESMRQAMPYLSSYISQKLSENDNFSYKDIILVGFSQGASFAVHASMFLSEKICCAISFSGGLANPNNAIERNGAKKVPICLIHGLEDQILPFQFSERGYKMLKSNNFDAELHLLKNTKHLITPEAIKIAEKFIDRLD